MDCIIAGVSIKAGYQWLPPPVEPLTAVCLDFINENKNDNKKANSTKMTTTETFKCYKNSTVFDAQNNGNHISELLDFKFFLGGGGGSMPPDPPKRKGALQPL